MADKTISTTGVIAMLRAMAPSMVGVLLVTLLLQFAGPLPGLFSMSLLPQGASDLVVVCSEGGVHYIHLDGTPADDDSRTPSKNFNGDCCTPACHIHGALLSAPAIVAPTILWTRRLADVATFIPPEAPPAGPFQARAPPQTA